MGYYCYIIYSNQLDKYYVGETSNIDDRLSMHNSGLFKQSYTTQSKDWIIYLKLKCSNRVHARKIESHIKSMKSRKYIENLKKYKEMQDKLINRFL